MQGKRAIISQTLAVVLLLVMGVYSLNSYFFTHSHILENGQIVTHAHPFDSSDNDPFKNHEHSSEELTFLANLSFFIPITDFLSLGVFLALITFNRETRENHRSLLAPFFTHLRAPPAIG